MTNDDSRMRKAGKSSWALDRDEFDVDEVNKRLGGE